MIVVRSSLLTGQQLCRYCIGILSGSSQNVSLMSVSVICVHFGFGVAGSSIMGSQLLTLDFTSDC